MLRGGCLLCSFVVAGIYEISGHNQHSSFVLGCRFKDIRRNLQKDIGESSVQSLIASHCHGMGKSNVSVK